MSYDTVHIALQKAKAVLEAATPQVLEAHIMTQHRPDVACRREHRSDAEATWRLDFDAIVHGNPHIWFCSECGYYRQAE
jgi:hypothetical protein